MADSNIHTLPGNFAGAWHPPGTRVSGEWRHTRPTGIPQPLPQRSSAGEQPAKAGGYCSIIPPHITSTVPTWDGEEDIHYVKAESRKPGERPPGPAAPLPAELGELRTRPQTHTHTHARAQQLRTGQRWKEVPTAGDTRRAAPTLGGGSAGRSAAPTHPQPRTPKTRRSVKQARAQGPRDRATPPRRERADLCLCENRLRQNRAEVRLHPPDPRRRRPTWQATLTINFLLVLTSDISLSELLFF